jgi:sugar/nucleoside kinase (ribokinase family)
MLATPGELIDQTLSLTKLRHEAGVKHRPLIIWEPRPSSCTPENRKAFFQAVRMVDIFSPNHIEIAQIFGKPSPEIIDRGVLERHASLFVQSGVGRSKSGAVVVRAGEEGCFVVSSTHPVQWVPSYYTLVGDANPSKIVDPTGAGNAFLGAFAIGYLDTCDLFHAACYGNVGASFALEQIGVPTVEVLEAGKELWNGSDVYSRLRDYRARLR